MYIAFEHVYHIFILITVLISMNEKQKLCWRRDSVLWLLNSLYGINIYLYIKQLFQMDRKRLHCNPTKTHIQYQRWAALIPSIVPLLVDLTVDSFGKDLICSRYNNLIWSLNLSCEIKVEFMFAMLAISLVVPCHNLSVL